MHPTTRARYLEVGCGAGRPSSRDASKAVLLSGAIRTGRQGSPNLSDAVSLEEEVAGTEERLVTGTGPSGWPNATRFRSPVSCGSLPMLSDWGVTPGSAPRPRLGLCDEATAQAGDGGESPATRPAIVSWTCQYLHCDWVTQHARRRRPPCHLGNAKISGGNAVGVHDTTCRGANLTYFFSIM